MQLCGSDCSVDISKKKHNFLINVCNVFWAFLVLVQVDTTTNKHTSEFKKHKKQNKWRHIGEKRTRNPQTSQKFKLKASALIRCKAPCLCRGFLQRVVAHRHTYTKLPHRRYSRPSTPP